MKIVYYYSDSCGSCKGYEDVVDRLSTELKITLQKRNIKDGVSHEIEGVPSIIIEEGDSVLYKSVGNLPYEHLISDVRKNVK